MGLHYKYALANVWWNKNAQDQPLFKSELLLKNYFETVRTAWSDLSNFIIRDNVNTSTFIEVPTTMTINEVLNYHYLLVQELDDNNQEVRVLHYFADISQECGNQYRCELERDVIIDYYCLGNIRNRPYTMIYRTHLDRYVYENNKFKVNGSNNSPLYIAEDTQLDTPICDKRKIINTDSNVTSEYHNHPLWVYVYLNLPNNHAMYNPYYEDGINQGYTLLVFPIFDGIGSNLKVNDVNYIWSINSFLKTQTSILPYILNIRISCSNPFGNIDYINCPIGYSEERQGLLANYKSIYNTNANITPGAFNGSYKLISYVVDTTTYYTISILNNVYSSNQYTEGKIKDIFGISLSIDKAYIKGARSIEKEVKLYNGIIKAIINFGTTNGNEYNLLSLLYNLDEDAKYKLVESLVPGITRCYHGLICDTSIYNENNFNNLKQNNTSSDTSIPFSINQYETFLAQNKNFYQSANLRRTYGVIKGTVGNISGMIENGIKKDYSGVFNNFTNSLFAISDVFVDYQQQEYTMDNLRNAPTDIRNLEGNPLLGIKLVGLNPRFEIWKPMQSNLSKIVDYLFFNGYKYNKLGKLSDFDNTRKYFNFIQGDINGICYNMNDRAYKLLRDKLLIGVRFWHENPGNINFENEDNYESWVDDIE